MWAMRRARRNECPLPAASALARPRAGALRSPAGLRLRVSGQVPLRGFLVPIIAASALAGCSEPPRGNLKYLEQDQIRVEQPSKDHALVTGIGCGFTLKEAEQRAREVSAFNLRRVTGDARYRVEFTRVREVPDPNQACVETEARAIPPLPH